MSVPNDNPGVPDRSDFVIVANRLPVVLEQDDDGTERWKRSPGGLVTALEPFLRARDGIWVGWPGETPARLAPFTEGGLRMHPVGLGPADFRDYYEGFANSTLWPLYHDAVMPPVYNENWWEAYVRVNRHFAEAAATAAADAATVWVQDYQLQLVPAMLRELRPDLRIGFFLHIPFPPAELFMQLPWRAEIVSGLLGADLVGFQRPGGALNFRRLAQRTTGASTRAGRHGQGAGLVRLADRTVSVGSFPISVDTNDIDALARTEPVRRRSAVVRAQLGNPRKMLLGVDRLDYTKGIDVRLRALHALLAEGRVSADDIVMVQIATPSRERVEHYRRLRSDIEEIVGRINGEFGDVGRPVVHYLHTSVDRAELTALYSAADVMLVTPLRDGMNLVCKEYVASRHDLGGALVLSEFAGAAAELTGSLLVNPHHLEGVKDALLHALRMEPEESRRRMHGMRRHVLDRDVEYWARSYLEALAAGPAPGLDEELDPLNSDVAA